MDILDKLDQKHKDKLEWFLAHKNLEVSWGETAPGKNGLRGNEFLFSTPKGIYKPHDSNFVLSIRVMMNSHYPDQKVITRDDGSWSFRYYREEISNKDPNSLFTNKGLISCMENNIPIGVAIQTSGKPHVKYLILGIANVSDYKDGFFQINGYSNEGDVINESFYGVYSSELDHMSTDPFDPKSQEDARNRVLKQIVLRQGQKKFREQLLRIYNSSCLISKCCIPSVLEAAHITPYLGPKTNDVSNGIILRSDIHVLWDLGLIAIHPYEMKVCINSLLEGSEYGVFNNADINSVINSENPPSLKALESQWSLFLTKCQI